MVDVDAAAEGIVEVCRRVAAESDRFRELDAQLGDGDLGITVAYGCEAAGARAAAGGIETFDALFAAVGEAFSEANPSTMGGLVGIGLRKAAREAGSVATLDAASWASLLEAAIEGIQRRGGAAVGDKTILDALSGSHARLSEDGEAQETGGSVARAVREGAERGAAAVVDQTSRVGRASWQGDRSRGIPDPGAELWCSIARAIEAVAGGDPAPRTPGLGSA